MDPLSVIASIAGVSTAGIALSRAIYDIISSVRNAPKEISDIAKGLCDLSFILRELRRVLKDGQDVYRRQLIRRVASAIKRVSRIQDEIEDLLDLTGKGAKLKWLFRKSKIQGLLYTIESYKTGINMILQTMMLAVQLKQLSKEDERRKKSSTVGFKEDEDTRNETVFARQQVENFVEVSYHSLRELASEQRNATSHSESEEEEESNDHLEQSRVQKYESPDPHYLDSATWLYDLVFSSVIEQNSTSSSASTTRPHGLLDQSAEEIPSSQALTYQRHSPPLQLQSLHRHPPAASRVVNELLSEWTTLTEGEIMAADKINCKQKDSRLTPDSHPSSGQEEVIKFENAVGTKFLLPFRLVHKWSKMEAMINQMFVRDDFRYLASRGDYDIVDMDNKVVPRSEWEHTVEPGDHYKMMWRPDDRRREAPARRRPADGHLPATSKNPSGSREKKAKSSKKGKEYVSIIPWFLGL
ncbi:hypothetical protein F5B22DRAFT_603052 [Xylaria bambusicola]|uniref:uncharacterized protein n=1 Tax=Xylaria bambusicola TaxID=326684 RepID=UPI0020072F06|nr:uncharacterized protein F5B22DRAFT_603052 [Xylaria bambusicola]KAI0517461.1 hypothetical protein F5B22DRAFT_603052 [Xylaria bambusicola]